MPRNQTFLRETGSKYGFLYISSQEEQEEEEEEQRGAIGGQGNSREERRISREKQLGTTKSINL